jgi:polyferredoxin
VFVFRKPAALRRSVRLAFALVCIAGGVRLFFHLLHVAGQGPAVSRPPVAEGFLPIAAALGLKRLLAGGGWDPVHPAGLTILLAALAASWLLRRSFCGHVCPVGLLSETLGDLGRKMGLGRRGPRSLGLVLGTLKFLLLAFFLAQIAAMDLDGLNEFLFSPYNITADARLLRFWLAPSATALAALAGLAALGLVFRNAWCRWLCPYGALLGLAALAGPTAVRREHEACTGCSQCERRCPAGLRIQSRTSMRGTECIGCGQCAANCPSGALSVRLAGRRISWLWLCLGAAGILLGAWALAEALGHWRSALPGPMLDRLYSGVLGGN